MNNPKTIDLFTPSFNDGGMENRTIELANQLHRSGWRVRVWVFNSTNPAYHLLPGIDIIDLKITQKAFAIFKLLKAVWTYQPKKLVSISTPFNALWIIVKMATGYPRKLAVSERNHLTAAVRTSNKIVSTLRPFITRWLYPNADLVLCVSESVRSNLLRASGLKPEKVITIWNMFDITAITRQAMEPEPLLDQISIETPLIISVGRLNKQKNHSALINAFADVHKKINCGLVILGEGRARRQLDRQIDELNIREKVIMPGFMENPYPWLKRADVVVLPSLFEGLPGVLVEALALGKTIVATDCPGGSSEILDGGKYGTLVPVGDHQALVAAIISAINNPTDPETLIARSRLFSIEELLSKTERILTDL